MKHRVSALLVSAVLCLAPAALADLSAYNQDFEGLAQADPAALTNDGWLVFGNVFTANFAYIYGYGPFVAPNGGAGFSAIDAGQGDIAQGVQQLSIYSDYNNGDHGNNRFIEANVFQEQTVGNNDVGNTWIFSFDAKRGNIEGSTTALAFFKTLDPNNGFALTNFVTVDMTNVPEVWGRYSLSIFIDPTLVGQILQFGYLSTATNYEGSGIFYDNLSFLPEPKGACCTPFECTELRGDECVGEYQGDGTTCGEADCTGPLFIELCHMPPGNPGNAHTITVGLAAAQAHLNHGDTLGVCEAQFTPRVVLPLSNESPGFHQEFQQSVGSGQQQQSNAQPARTLGGKQAARSRDE